MKRIIVIFLICAFPSTISAQNTSESIVENFFNVYKNNSSDAIDYLFQDNKWMEDKFEELLNLKSQLFENQKLLGEFCGYEKITEQNAGKDYKQLVYLVKYERQPIRFIFELYKPKEKWIVLNFSYDFNFDSEFIK